jgi:ubiquinone/menaquinone biosynthesis C-methylase UbiE
MIKKRFSFRSLINAISHFNFRRIEECSTLIRWLAAKPGEHILDVGCGDGYYDKLIGKSGAKVIGIDIHERRLSTAYHLYRSEDTEFIYMDAAGMSFREASFDKVVSFCVVEHFYNDEQVIWNISRVLKPGGCFVFSADSLSNPGITAQERARHQQRYAVNTFYTKENVREKLFRAGFDIEKEQYIITTPPVLALIRLSWKLDKLPRGLAVVRVPGYLVLGAIWKVVSHFAERNAVHSGSGLTLLIHAKKRDTDGGNR